MPRPVFLHVNLTIDAVDSDTRYNLVTTNATDTLKFLAKYDHEGSHIVATLTLGDEMVYKILDFCASLERAE